MLMALLNSLPHDTNMPDALTVRTLEPVTLFQPDGSYDFLSLVVTDSQPGHEEFARQFRQCLFHMLYFRVCQSLKMKINYMKDKILYKYMIVHSSTHI